MLKEEALTQKTIGACIEVHRHLGPGLLESTYRRCLCEELRLRGLGYECEKPLPVRYKGILVDCAYRIDIVVEGKVLLETKSVNALEPIHEAQLLTYMRLGSYSIGLLVNFNVRSLRMASSAASCERLRVLCVLRGGPSPAP